MIRGADDLLADLGHAVDVAASADPPVELPDDEARAWRAVLEPTLPDAVARAAQMSIPDAVTALIRLELRGLVRSVGGRYERTLSLPGDEPGV
jgi:predicted Rossmann fold nucleotide-binding protein DprA/Smf involved in DNA uptake